MAESANSNFYDPASRASSTTKNGLSPKDASRHYPIAPLAPLEFLQNQRRGSITDPSLHAAPTSLSVKPTTSYRPAIDPSLTSASASPTQQTHYDSNSKNHLSDPRPLSPYVFGNATVQALDNNPQIRKLLRSPSLEHNHRPSSALSHSSHELSRTISGTMGSKDHNQMNIDSDRQDHQIPSRRTTHEQQPFDYNMRRHSIAHGQSSHTLPHLSSLPHGTKRKMSGDRSVFAPVGEEMDPQLVGPGVPRSAMDVDVDAPAPKRRGSAIDTQKIAQLSLNDRRNSVDARGSSQWWERRDSTSSMLSNVSSMGGFSPIVTPGDSPHSRMPSGMAFSWSANTHSGDPSGPPGLQNDADPSPSRPSFDTGHPMGMMPPLNFAPSADRRMSVPDTLTSGPTRVLRSRSRPPSRQNYNTDTTQSGPPSGQEDPSSSSPTTSNKTLKDSTPYSRSPELRVSHKLAERKRRKEMKDLFDELRDQLPADRGMKASKWEILSKAIDFIAQLKQNHQDMVREIDLLRRDVDTMRGSNHSFSLNGPTSQPTLYGSSAVVTPFPPTAPGTLQQQPQQHQQQPQHTPHQLQPLQHVSRPGSSQNLFSPGVHSPTQNGRQNSSDAALS